MIARIGTRIVAMSLLATLGACSEGPPTGAKTAPSSEVATKPTQTSEASAEEVAKEKRGKVRCPAKVSMPARASDAPVDDVVGVRPGMTFEEAANVVMCTHDLLVVSEDTSRRFEIQTYGHKIRQGFAARFAEPRVHKTSQQIMQEMQDNMMARANNAVRRDMKPGQAKWYVTTMGLPGQERVIAAARDEWFEEGRNPTLDSVEQALVKKYGPPTHNERYPGGRRLAWAYDPLGRRITETSPLYRRCNGTADPNGATNFSPDCGIVVTAEMRGMRDNAGLAQLLQVGVMDKANGYEAIVGTEQALLALDAERKARELEEASKNAAAPQL
jgi:hypothetical protein